MIRGFAPRNRHALYSLLPYDIEYTPYDTTHVLAQLQLLFFSALAFVWLNLRGMYPPELPSINIDVEWLYRKPLPRIARGLAGAACVLKQLLSQLAEHTGRSINSYFARSHGAGLTLARDWPIGSMVLWVALLLGLYLIFYLMSGLVSPS